MSKFAVISYLTDETTPRHLALKVRSAVSVVGGGGASVPIDAGAQYAYAPGKSKRSYGIHARYIVISRSIGTDGGPFTTSTVSAKIAIGTPGQMTGFPVGFVVTYAGKSDWTVVRQVQEVRK